MSDQIIPNSVGILLFDEVEELDFVGPWEMFGVWKQYFSGPQQLMTVSERGGEVACAKGLKVHADYAFANCPQLDCLVVPGGWGTRAEVNNTKLIDFIRGKAAHCQHVLSVCTGAFLLQAAGLLQNKKATTHWKSLDRLREFNDIEVVEQRFVRDGCVWSSSGVSAGIDLTLFFIAEVAGAGVAGDVQRQAEYYPSDRIYPNSR